MGLVDKIYLSQTAVSCQVILWDLLETDSIKYGYGYICNRSISNMSKYVWHKDINTDSFNV